MKLIFGLQNLPTQPRGCVATIGNFDGVHLGHHQLLKKLQTEAMHRELHSTLIIMEPHPQEYFCPESPPARLTSLREKIINLKQYELDQILCLRFNAKLAAQNAEDFVRLILVEALNVKHLIIGHDFRFGHQRKGDYQLLSQLGEQYGFTVSFIEPVMLQAQRVSSSHIRQLLKLGEMEQAKQLLGRGYRICGRVTYGDQRGRQLGFPTANILLRRLISPITGVFAVKVYDLDNGPLFAVANVGYRPTVDGKRCQLEVHILDFNQNIYGRYIEVEFLHKLRDEQRFDSLELLKQQISLDKTEACRFFNTI